MKKLIILSIFFLFIPVLTWALDTGAHSPGTTSEIDSGLYEDWTNTDNVKTSNNVRATSSLNIHDQSETLLVTNFAFDVPAGATINGILVQCEVSTSGEATGAIKELNLQMYRDGAAVGSNLANTTTWLGSADHGGEDQTYNSGGATNLWGTTWTAAQINDAGTGVIFSAKEQGSGNEVAQVDHIKITVYYTVATFVEIGEGPQTIVTPGPLNMNW